MCAPESGTGVRGASRRVRGGDRGTEEDRSACAGPLQGIKARLPPSFPRPPTIARIPRSCLRCRAITALPTSPALPVLVPERLRDDPERQLHVVVASFSCGVTDAVAAG